jgi:hypothetical protein
MSRTDFGSSQKLKFEVPRVDLAIEFDLEGCILTSLGSAVPSIVATGHETESLDMSGSYWEGSSE